MKNSKVAYFEFQYMWHCTICTIFKLTSEMPEGG